MTEVEKAINEVLEGIEVEIQRFHNSQRQANGMRYEDREHGFEEGLRLCRAIVRARYIEEDASE